MELSKHLEFFNPVELDKPIHIIGLGAIGSNLAMQLTRLGCTNFYLYDFDKVEPKNIANQIYYYQDRDQLKTDATAYNMRSINPDVKLRTFDKGYTSQALSGYVFLAVDNIDLRRTIVEENQLNSNIDSIYDFRMGLSDAQHYAADWTDKESIKRLLSTMQFTREEAAAAQPVSACGTTLSVLPTIQIICASGISNFINHVKGEGLKPMVLIDSFAFSTLVL